MSFFVLQHFDNFEGDERRSRLRIGTFTLGTLGLAVSEEEKDQLAYVLVFDGLGFGPRWQDFVLKAVVYSRDFQVFVGSKREGWSHWWRPEDDEGWVEHEDRESEEEDRVMAEEARQLLPFLRVPNAELVAAKVFLKACPQLFLLVRHKPDGNQVITLEGLEATQNIVPAKRTLDGLGLLRMTVHPGRPPLEESVGHHWREIAESAKTLKKEEPSRSWVHIAVELHVTERTLRRYRLRLHGSRLIYCPILSPNCVHSWG